jgi:cell division protein FtsI/penicillin-binding protein 2
MQRGRVHQFRAMVFLFLAVIVARLVWIQGVTAATIVAKGDRRQETSLTPLRGAIVDRTGRSLAVSVPVSTVVVNANRLTGNEPAEAAAKLGPILGMAPADIEKRIKADPLNGFIKLKERIDFETADKVQKAKIDGISIIPDAIRQYPQGATSLNLLGYLDNESKGVDGLEASYEKQLRGEPGWVKAELTETNTPIAGTVAGYVPSKPGLDLMLSVDTALMGQFEQKLDQVVKEQDAKHGFAIAMDVHTGEILAMAQSPRESILNRSNWDLSNLVTLDKLKNWGIATIHPPGSIFKTITSSVALEERAITPQTIFMDGGKLQVGTDTILNWDQFIPTVPKPSTLSELMQRSSNVGMIKVGQTVKRDRYLDYLKQFGLLQPTGIDLPGEIGPFLGDSFSKKKDIDWANIYIGQHIEYTPIQVITAIAAVANGGYLIQPHLVKEVRDPSGQVVETISSKPRRQVISEETAKEVQSVMLDVIAKGYPQGQPKGYVAGGKTGTAQLFDPLTGQMKDRTLADFVGFAPANNPQVLLMIMIDEPKPPGYGGQIVAPIFAELMPLVMQTIGIPPDSKAAQGQDNAPPKVEDGVVPEVRWLPVERAKDQLVAAGFTVDVQGKSGVVATQSAAPGSRADRKKAVTITLTENAAKPGYVRVPSFLGLSLAEANSLAQEVGLGLKGMVGTGFVAAQEHAVGAEVPKGATLSLRLAPPPLPRGATPPAPPPHG